MTLVKRHFLIKDNHEGLYTRIDIILLDLENYNRIVGIVFDTLQ